jgi:hypothetical protein
LQIVEADERRTSQGEARADGGKNKRCRAIRGRQRGAFE